MKKLRHRLGKEFAQVCYGAGRHAHIGCATERTGVHTGEKECPRGKRGGRTWEGAQGRGKAAGAGWLEGEME